jgi:hypothetical protein
MAPRDESSGPLRELGPALAAARVPIGGFPRGFFAKIVCAFLIFPCALPAVYSDVTHKALPAYLITT